MNSFILLMFLLFSAFYPLWELREGEAEVMAVRGDNSQNRTIGKLKRG